jgi:hypothetical protein
MSSLVRFHNLTEAEIIDSPIQEGHLYFASDTAVAAYDLGGKRHWLRNSEGSGDNAVLVQQEEPEPGTCKIWIELL